MKELVGKLTALDPEASKTLTVIAYFDTLMDGRVGVETLLRGAATLCGVAAGYRRGAEVIRVLADGSRGEATDSTAYVSHPVGPDTVVWIERAGPAHSNDAMVRERLAIALAMSVTTGRPDESPVRRAIEQLLTQPFHELQHRAATDRLQLDPTVPVRAIALPAQLTPPAGWPTAILVTRWGLVRGGIVGARAAPPVTVAGIGSAGPVVTLTHSWRTAVVALLLTDEARPVFRADDLGTLLHLTELIDSHTRLPSDVVDLDQLIGTTWSRQTLQVLADGGSVRAAASAAGLHHSSVHAKLPELTRQLGYDPLTPLGRTRMFTALLLQRLAHQRFDGMAPPVGQGP